MLISGHSLKQTWGCSKKVLLACCPPLANKVIQDRHRREIKSIKALYVPNEYKQVFPNAPHSPSDDDGNVKVGHLTNTGWKNYPQWCEEKERDLDIYSKITYPSKDIKPLPVLREHQSTQRTSSMYPLEELEKIKEKCHEELRNKMGPNNFDTMTSQKGIPNTV